jgi:hypothetical protein
MPARVKTPPIMAQTCTKNLKTDSFLSLNLTETGDKSYLKTTGMKKASRKKLFQPNVQTRHHGICHSIGITRKLVNRGFLPLQSYIACGHHFDVVFKNNSIKEDLAPFLLTGGRFSQTVKRGDDVSSLSKTTDKYAGFLNREIYFPVLNTRFAVKICDFGQYRKPSLSSGNTQARDKLAGVFLERHHRSEVRDTVKS